MNIPLVRADTSMAGTCQALSPYACRGTETFEHLIQEGCLNQKKYRSSCVHSFCTANCAMSPCVKGDTGKLCRIYCRDVALSDPMRAEQMKRCLAVECRPVKSRSALKSNLPGSNDYKDFDTLKKICRQRDVLFHVDGLRLGSSSTVTIAHFKKNVDRAIHLTTIINQILRKIVHGADMSGVEMQAKVHLEKSDEHAQYFANVTGNFVHLCKRLREVIELGQVQEKEGSTPNHSVPQGVKVNAHQQLMLLIERRDRLFSIDSVTVPNGATVRITDFMKNVQRATALSYGINRIYIDLSQANLLTPAEKAHFLASNKRVFLFVDDVYALQEKNKVLIHALAKGETYRS